MNTNDCYAVILDRAAIERRTQRVAECARVVEAYGRAHDEAVELGTAQPHCRAGLRDALADRAFESEQAVRMLIADHLQTLNELRDAGQLERALGEAARIGSRKDFDWSKALAEAGRKIEATLGIDPGLLGRAAEIFQRHGVEIAPGDDGTVNATIIGASGQPERFVIRGSIHPGDPGRVSVEDLLGPGGIVAVIPVHMPDDCHHRSQIVKLHNHLEPIDAYKVNVAALALARETVYRHARTMAEIGPSAFSGEDPITAVAVAFVVVGVVVAGVGVALVVSGDSTGWFLIGGGLILAGGGLCVLSGACAFAAGGVVGVGV